MNEKQEFRVRWQREGMAKRTAIYQTEQGAQAKVKALLWSEKMRDENPGMDASDDWHERHFAAMPRLLATPHIEARVVGEWAEREEA